MNPSTQNNGGKLKMCDFVCLTMSHAMSSLFGQLYTIRAQKCLLGMLNVQSEVNVS